MAGNLAWVLKLELQQADFMPEGLSAQHSSPALNMLCAGQDRHVPNKADTPLSAACPTYPYRRRVGLIGGSFNPAHKGHLHIARQARQAARLDEVWLLVSPQNPLKSEKGMAPFVQRLASARDVAQPYSWIKVLDFEQKKALQFTADSLSLLVKRCPRADLIWIMGADNLIQFPQWERAYFISRLLPIIVVNRPHYRFQALASALSLIHI